MYNGYCSFEPYFPGNHLLIRFDNTTAIAFARDMGGMSCPLRDHFARKLWDRASKKDCWLTISHIRGVDNYQAALASRLFNDRTEWTLPQDNFVRVAKKFRCPSIDMFASMLNYKTARYVSWFPDPKCTEVDAFSISWQNEFPYLFPPFNLIYRCLENVQQQLLDKAIVVFPIWPNQQWFPQLLHVMIRHPVLIPQQPPLFSSLGRQKSKESTSTDEIIMPSSHGDFRSALETAGVPSAITARIHRGIRKGTRTLQQESQMDGVL